MILLGYFLTCLHRLCWVRGPFNQFNLLTIKKHINPLSTRTDMTELFSDNFLSNVNAGRGGSGLKTSDFYLRW